MIADREAPGGLEAASVVSSGDHARKAHRRC
jgi:hypothetical protein